MNIYFPDILCFGPNVSSMCKDAAVNLVHLSLSRNMKLPKHMLVASDYVSVTQKNTKTTTDW